MSKFWFVCRFIGFFVFIGLLIFGGISVFNAGLAQGHVTSAAPAAAASSVNPAAAYPAWGFGMHPMGFMPGFFCSGVIHLILFFLLIGLAARLFFGCRHMGMGHKGFGNGHCWHGGYFHHRFTPPSPDLYNQWYQEWQKNDTSKNQEDKDTENQA